MRTLSYASLAALLAGPALAAGKSPFSAEFYSLKNTDFVVLLAFLLFIGVLLYLKVPSKLGGLLDKRADDIRAELDEARKLREEAQSVLASYERKAREVEDQAKQIVEHAKTEARAAADQAKVDIENSIARRLQAAEDRIASAEAGALRDVKDRAAEVAVAVAAEMMSSQMTGDQNDSLIDEAIRTVDAKLH
jgi:F-type H+-transporting ATPase subunit b